MKMTEKAAYLKGLADGLEYDKTTKEGKLIAALLDMVDALAERVDELDCDLQELNDYVEELDEDLGDVEELLYDDEDCCDGDCDCCAGLELAFISLAVLIFLYSISVLQTRSEMSLVFCSVCLAQDTLAFHHSVNPLTIIDIAIR